MNVQFIHKRTVEADPRGFMAGNQVTFNDETLEIVEVVEYFDDPKVGFSDHGYRIKATNGCGKFIEADYRLFRSAWDGWDYEGDNPNIGKFTQDALEELYTHKRDCNCPRCSGDL